MNGEDRTYHVRNEMAHGYYGNVVQAGIVRDGLHIHQGFRDAPSDLENPVIVSVRREPGACLADLVVDAEPPRMMAPSGTLYIVTLQARTTRAVILHAARPVVLSRRPPRPACLMPRFGRAITPRYFRTDLDSEPPRLHAEGPDFPFTISATDVEQFRFEVVVSADEVYWQLELDWSCAEYEGSVVIDDNGRPFEAYPVAALFSDRSPSVLHSGCELMQHQPGCPALRLEAASTPAPPPLPTVAPGPAGAPAARPDRPQPDGVGDLLRAALDLDAAMQVTDPDDPASWPDYQRLATLVRTLLSRPGFQSHESEPFRALFVRYVRYCYASGQSQTGATAGRAVHRSWTAALGEGHPHTLDLADRLVGCLAGTGAYEQARGLCEDLLRLRYSGPSGAQHPRALVVVGNLAACLTALKDYEAAQALALDMLQQYRPRLGPDHPDILRTAGNLSSTLLWLKDYEGARAVAEDTLQRYRSTLGPDHPDTLYGADHLAASLHELGEEEAARALYEDTLERRTRVLGEHHPDTLKSKERCRLLQR